MSITSLQNKHNFCIYQFAFLCDSKHSSNGGKPFEKDLSDKSLLWTESLQDRPLRKSGHINGVAIPPIVPLARPLTNRLTRSQVNPFANLSTKPSESNRVHHQRVCLSTIPVGISTWCCTYRLYPHLLVHQQTCPLTLSTFHPPGSILFIPFARKSVVTTSHVIPVWRYARMLVYPLVLMTADRRTGHPAGSLAKTPKNLHFGLQAIPSA